MEEREAQREESSAQVVVDLWSTARRVPPRERETGSEGRVAVDRRATSAGAQYPAGAPFLRTSETASRSPVSRSTATAWTVPV